MTAKAITGHCLCGAVRVRAREVVPEIYACHCGMCRRWSSAPGLGTSAGGVSFEGEENLARHSSSEWMERGFCKICGTHLFCKVKASERYVLWSGCLDDPARFQMTGEIYIEDKPDFYDFAGERPRMTGEEFLQSLAAKK